MESSSSSSNDTKVKVNLNSLIEAASVKPIPFIITEPETWFFQMENQFDLANITQEQTKLKHITSALPTNVLSEFKVHWKPPFIAGQYTKLKEAIIQVYQESETKRLTDLLDNEQIGDRTPTRFYLHLKAKVDGLNVSEQIIKNRWISKLPPKIQESLVCMMDLPNVPWESILKMSDNINAISQSIPQISTVDNNKYQRSRSKSPHFRLRSHSRNRSHSKRQFNEKGKYCWYHFRFGKEAKKCKDPCKFNQGN